MALTRKFLTALGIDAEKIDEIIEAHSSTLNEIKAERDELKALAGEVEPLKKELKETKSALEASGSDSFKVKYEALKEEFDTFKADQEAKAVLANKEKAYRALLKEAGISEKRIDAVMRVTKLEDVELDGDKLKDAEKLTETVKTEWADFITKDAKGGAGVETPPPGDNGAKPPKTIPTIF